MMMRFFLIVFSYIKENKECSYFHNIIYFYFKFFIEKNIKNIPYIFISNYNSQTNSSGFISALHYNFPDAFSQSFFFIVYRKKLFQNF